MIRTNLSITVLTLASPRRVLTMPSQAAINTAPAFNLGWSLGATNPNAHWEGASALVVASVYVISGAALALLVMAILRWVLYRPSTPRSGVLDGMGLQNLSPLGTTQQQVPRSLQEPFPPDALTPGFGPLPTPWSTSQLTSPPGQTGGVTSTLEIAHVLFMDIVGYSNLHMEVQRKLVKLLQEMVRNTAEFARAHAKKKLVCLPTGDGLALVFFGDPVAPVRCAVELGSALRKRAELKLRMGIHAGPIYRVPDINANVNIAGMGINMAQRVMDCGDEGHILVSRAVADTLSQLGKWENSLKDLGDAEVKHGVHIHVYNLHTSNAGNPELPQKLRRACATEFAAAEPAAADELGNGSARSSPPTTEEVIQ